MKHMIKIDKMIKPGLYWIHGGWIAWDRGWAGHHDRWKLGKPIDAEIPDPVEMIADTVTYHRSLARCRIAVANTRKNKKF